MFNTIITGQVHFKVRGLWVVYVCNKTPKYYNEWPILETFWAYRTDIHKTMTKTIKFEGETKLNLGAIEKKEPYKNPIASMFHIVDWFSWDKCWTYLGPLVVHCCL